MTQSSVVRALHKLLVKSVDHFQIGGRFVKASRKDPIPLSFLLADDTSILSDKGFYLDYDL